MALVKLNAFSYFIVLMVTLPSFFNISTTSICFNLTSNWHSLFLNVVGMNYEKISTVAKPVFSNNLYNI